MKFSLKLPSGATVDFEGDADEFALISGFLEEPPDSLLAEAVEGDAEEIDRGDDDDESDGLSPLDARAVAKRLEIVGAETELDRVTVIAQLAVEAGQDGADYETLDRLYTELGLRKPPRFTKSVANAKTAGLVRTSGYGRWRPTVKGENLARGLSRERDKRRAPRSKDRANSGGDGD